MAPNTHTDGDEVALAVQLHQMLIKEREWTEERFARLEGHIQDGNETIQSTLASVTIQLAGLRCPEHRQQVEETAKEVKLLRGEMKRRQLFWSGSGFAAGLAAAVAGLNSLLGYLKGAGN